MEHKQIYVLHIDGDSFFVAVELARRADLRGLPVITGGERGIASAMSIEAKKLGVARGMPVFEIRKRFPEVHILPSDFHTYEQYSTRMIQIVERHTLRVERYSIDECFAEIYATEHEAHSIAQRIQKDIDIELSISVSIGVSCTKVLAKMAGETVKPHGICVTRNLTDMMRKLSVHKVWGIGKRTAVSLEYAGIYTIDDFVQREYAWVRSVYNKPIQEIWLELGGTKIYTVNGQMQKQQSFSRTRSFVEFSNNKFFVLSELSRNVERLCHDMRKNAQKSSSYCFFIKEKNGFVHKMDFFLQTPTYNPSIIISEIEKYLDTIWVQNVSYRSTGIYACKLIEETCNFSLFENNTKDDVSLQTEIQKLTHKYGHTICLSSSLQAHNSYKNDYILSRNTEKLKTDKEIFDIKNNFVLPFLGIVT